jgi:hypothetical protein
MGQETQVWLKFSYECNYLEKTTSDNLVKSYDNIIGKLVHPVK